MNRICIYVFCILCLVQYQTFAQDTVRSNQPDTVSYKIETDSAVNRQDPFVNPDDPQMIMGSSFQMPFVIFNQNTDFSYTDTRDSEGYGNYYTGLNTNDLFYKFSLGVAMSVTITHQGSVVSDTYMYLLDSNGNLIVSNDNYSGEGHCSNTNNSFIRRQLSAGTYYVVSEGKTDNGSITTNITGNKESGFNYPTIPSTYSTDPGNAVGAMGGQFAVSPMGGATYSIPIEVPQGIGGLQPQFSIVYNSQAGNGLCGYGASLAGISSITRGSKDIFHDGIADGISYLADDALYLDGVRLILSSGTAGQNGAVYHPESDPFTEVITHGTCTSTSNTIWFEVKSSDGMTYEYGNNYNSKLSYYVGSSQRIHSWYISKAEHPTGNYMIYKYLNPDIYNYSVYPDRISYGIDANQPGPLTNVVEFTYETRSDSVLLKFDGKRGRMGRRLKSIKTGTGNDTYREYVLGYNTMGDNTAYKFSRLTGVTVKNGDEETLPSTQFNWSYLPGVSYSSNNLAIDVATNLPSNMTTDILSHSFQTGDLNGDGIDDIICVAPVQEQNGNSTSSYNVVVIYYSERDAYGQVTFSATEDYYPISFVGKLAFSTTSMKGRMVVDIDGDGKNEIVIPVYKETDGSIASCIRFYFIGQNFDNDYHYIFSSDDIDPLFTSSDINNDGKTEIMYLETIQDNGGYALHIMKLSDSYTQGSIFVLQQLAQYSLSLPSQPKLMYFSDCNGDGLQDLMVLTGSGYKIYWNQGGASMFSESSYADGTNLKYYGNLSFGDFNGDGMIDLVTKETIASWHFYINDGNGGFSKTTAYYYPNPYNIYNTISHLDVLDFDGDGRSDVVITESRPNVPSDTVPITETFWLRSTGTGLAQVSFATSKRADDAISNRYITGDLDGDGRVELANYGYDCVNGINSYSNPVWRIYKNSNLTVQSGKVTSVKGDFGVTTNITYSTLTDNSVYTRGTDEPYPAPRYTIPINVVKQTVQDNGAAVSLTTKYTYEGLKAHLRGRGLLGFSKSTVNCTTLGVKTESGITQWDTAHYIPKVSYSKTIIGNSVAQTTNTLSIVDTYNNSHKLYFAYPSQTVATDMDGYTTTSYRSYNTEKGYITSDSTVYASNMYRAVSYRDYTQSKVGGAYRPQTVAHSQLHSDDSNPFTTITAYTYNSATGTVATRVDNYGSDKPLTTSFTYDPYGNILSLQSTGSGITTACTYYQYDASKRFPVRIYTYPASSVRKYTHDLWGNVLTERDSINSSISNTITHTYDNWGNLTRTDMPDGTSATWTRGWSSDAAQRWFVLEQGTARPWVKTWYDSRGREVKTESVGPENVSIVKCSYYNNKGQLEAHTTTTGDLFNGRGYMYDSRGRVQRVLGSEGIDISHSYGTQSGGNRTELVSENGRFTTYVYDAWGNLKGVTAPISSIANQYASNGGIRQTSSGGAIWTFGYDDRGNRTSMTDPDAGTTTYEYDALGRETSITDARNVVFVTNYDYLGRVTQRSAGGATITYTYGTSGNGQMSLISESNGTWTKSYAYDNLGRVTGEIMSKGNTFSRNRSYNYGNNGLVSTATMPGNKAIQYTYDTYGNLTGLDFNSGTIEWTLSGYTGRRTTSQTVIDNSSYPFVKTRVLDQYGYLDSLKTAQGSYYYQADKYTFDPIRGNLTQKAGYFDYSPYTYTYDNADRLRTVSDALGTRMSVTYSDNGNIKFKTGIGSYTYNTSSKPHAVTAVDNTDDIIGYNTQDISFNNWGKVTEVWQTDETDFYSYSIGYGPDMKRVTSKLDKTYNVMYEKYYWDDYEEKTSNGVTTRYWYVYGPDGLIGLYTEKDVQNATVSKAAVAITDHLGTILSLCDNSDNIYVAEYDEWGRRVVDQYYTPGFDVDLGYTGHEHIEELGLINMNGRMYDYNLGRFLSPDNYVQAPSNPQNFNRYSYCLNNPLKYTDPSGEYYLVDDLIAAAIGGVINVITNAFQGNIDNIGDFFAAFGAGAVGGFGALYPEFGGWVWGGATVGATNAWLGGATGNDIWKGAAIGAISGVTGGVAGQLGGQYLGNLVINGFNVASPVVKGAITGALGGAVGGYASGFTAGYIMTRDLKAANKAGLEGLWSGAAVGGVVGGGSGYRYAKKNNINPWPEVKKQNHTNDAHLPVGHKGSELQIVTPNKSQTIDGINYSGHAIDRMQGRGLVPSIVKDAITNPISVHIGNTPNTIVYESLNVRVVVNLDGTVVTVYPK